MATLALQQNGCNNGAGDDRVGKRERRGEGAGPVLGAGMERERPKNNLGQRRVVSKVRGNSHGPAKRAVHGFVSEMKV